MFPVDLHELIVSYLNNFKDMLSWRHTCRNTFHVYTVLFYCSKLYPFIITPLVKATDSTNLNLLKKRTYIQSLIVYTKFIKNDHLINLTNLEYLKIDNEYNDFKFDSNAFSNLKNLKTFICNNSFRLTDDILIKLSNLQVLDCSNCQNITSKSLSSLTNLVILKCDRNVRLDMSFVKKLTNLLSLTIDSSVQDNVDNFQYLSKLEYLYIPATGIKPEISKLLPKLLYINCGEHEYVNDCFNSNLVKLIGGYKCLFTDVTFSKLNNLQTLSLYRSQLIATNQVFSSLINLTELDCGISRFPDIVFKDMKKLVILDCEDNTMLTDNVFKFIPNLIQLKCGRNTNFTDNSISKLTNLKLLDCGSNTNLTDVTLSQLNNLKYLGCGFNRNFGNELLKIVNSLISLQWIYRNDDDVKYKEFMNIVKNRS